MIKVEKYGAIDIGSNAIRLLVASVIEQEGKAPLFKKTSLVRVPIRLGADVFVNGKISEYNTQRMIDAMNAFRLLMKTHQIKRYMACATSAMREASNGQDIVALINKEVGIFINIIDGDNEAEIIASTDLKSLIQKDKVFLYVDVGGGSTEFTIYAEGKTISSRSFSIGTVRLLNEMVTDAMWQELKTWIKEVTKDYKNIELIGSGGSINSIYKNSGQSEGKPLSYYYMVSFYDLVRSYSLEERITKMNMNTDRADVIVPATRIYLSAMKWAGADSIFVPKIGLSDGIIKSLYFEKIAEEIEVNN